MASLGSLCVGIILFVGLLIVWAVLRRLMGTKEPPAGTYNDKKIDSGGSIGGMRGGRSYDRPDIDSGGSIGGQREHRAHDHPDVDSGGSIGGRPSVGHRHGPGEDTGSTGGGWEIGGDSVQDQAKPREDSGRIDDPKIRSGGSFGG
jgi:hypothetical protein